MSWKQEAEYTYLPWLTCVRVGVRMCGIDRQAVGQAARQIVRHLDVDSQRNRYIGRLEGRMQ